MSGHLHQKRRLADGLAEKIKSKARRSHPILPVLQELLSPLIERLDTICNLLSLHPSAARLKISG